MKGQRLADGFVGAPDRGSYWRDEDGSWSCCTPNGRIGSLANHAVTEHEDGTITVTPSILVHPVEGLAYTEEERARLKGLGFNEFDAQGNYPGRPGWHGFLERGVWREC